MTLNPLLIAVSLFASGIAPVAHAAINKCVGTDGKVVFSDQPCVAGQATTQIKAAAKSAPAAVAKPLTAADLPKEGAATPNSNLQQYDSSCKEDRERLANATAKVKDTIDNQNVGYQKARVDKRCNPEARLAAAEKDVEAAELSCRTGRDELKNLKSRPAPPPGTGDYRAADISVKEGWINRNCPAAAR